MRRVAVLASLALLATPAMAQAPAQAPQQTLQVQVDGAVGQIDRVIQSMASLLIQQDAQIKQLQAALTEAKTAAPATMELAPKPSDKK